MTAERDQGVAEPVECPICDATPEPCEEHPDATSGPRGCHACNRAEFAKWIVHVGERRFCDGSGMRHADVACPGCAACATAATMCPAFALPDEPWISWLERTSPCVFCGGPPEAHRPMPPAPDESAAILTAEVAEGALFILRDPR